jgi:hypothetical protein
MDAFACMPDALVNVSEEQAVQAAIAVASHLMQAEATAQQAKQSDPAPPQAEKKPAAARPPPGPPATPAAVPGAPPRAVRSSSSDDNLSLVLHNCNTLLSAVEAELKQERGLTHSSKATIGTLQDGLKGLDDALARSEEALRGSTQREATLRAKVRHTH